MSFNQDERRRFMILLHALAQSAQDIETVRIMKRREQHRLEAESRLRAEFQVMAAESRQREDEERKPKANEEEKQRRERAERIRGQVADTLFDEAWWAFRRHDRDKMNRYMALWLSVNYSSKSHLPRRQGAIRR